MRKLTVITLSLTLLVSSHASARDDRLTLSIADAYESLDITSKLEGMQMFFGDQPHPKVAKSIAIVRTNRKTNAFNKSDKQACEWVFLSTLLSLKDRALVEGGNAVVNIKSNYKNREFSSPNQFQCGAGAVIAGAALMGKIVKLADPTATTPEKREPKAVEKNNIREAKCAVKQVLDMKETGLNDAQIKAACD